MTNSHSKFLLGMLDAIHSDIIRAIPGLSKELARDYQRVSSCVNSRGLRVLTIDLPALGKEYDYSLSERRLTLTSSYLTGRRKKGSPIPRLYGGLVMRVFDDDGVLRTDPCPQAIRFLRQVCYFAKKWRITCEEKLTYREVREFYRVDAEVKRPTLNWREPFLEPGDLACLRFGSLVDEYEDVQLSFESKDSELVHIRDLDLAFTRRALDRLQRVADLISVTLGEFNPLEWSAKHGPGVVSDLQKGESKYDFPQWPERLEAVFPYSTFAFASEEHWADEQRINLREGHRINNGDFYSKLIAVPKTQKGPRLIAAEPAGNQWCQQIIRDFLYDRVEHSWIRRMITFRDQTRNQRMALAASADASSSTIDLSAASDRMSCWVVERMFRRSPSLVSALHSSRTFIIRNSIDKKCSEFSFLNKFSTMGSAVTFPVQSLVFASVALAVRFAMKPNYQVTKRNCERMCRGISVFGDDIIVPNDSAESTMRLLEHLGFKVNTSKTFTGSSRFRESCGVDAYAGNDVTPCYALTSPKRSAPDSYVSMVATAHNFYSRGYMSVVTYIRRTTLKVAPSLELPWVKCGSGIFGWPSPMGFDVGRCKQRFNRTLQRLEYRTRRVITRVERYADRGPSRLLQYFTERPSPMVNWTSGVVVKGRTLTRFVWEPLPFQQ